MHIFHWPDNHVTRNTAIHKEKIKMINLVICKSSCIIELFVQSHNSSNTVFLEVRYVGFWCMERISWSTNTSCQPKTGSQQWTNKWNRMQNKLWYVQLTPFNSFTSKRNSDVHSWSINFNIDDIHFPNGRLTVFNSTFVMWSTKSQEFIWKKQKKIFYQSKKYNSPIN